ncbi:hypothetical protein AAY47_19815, partial [Xenorhabdus griffiniae]
MNVLFYLHFNRKGKTGSPFRNVSSPYFLQGKHVMSSQPDHQKAFIALFNQTARYHRRYQVFQDFCNCAMAAIHNKYCYSEALEQYYLKT